MLNSFEILLPKLKVGKDFPVEDGVFVKDSAWWIGFSQDKKLKLVDGIIRKVDFWGVFKLKIDSAVEGFRTQLLSIDSIREVVRYLGLEFLHSLAKEIHLVFELKRAI